MSESIRVLHVDDEPDFADMAATFVERQDDRIQVETTSSASEGLDRLADDIDCIVSDHDMPRQNGIEFLEIVRENHPDLPFILFTGKGSEVLASEAISAGVTDYLQKESNTEQFELLANRIRNVVDQYRATRRADNLQRIRSLVNDVNQALVRADSREEIETRVCKIMSESDPDLFAWIGEVDPGTDRIEPRAAAGVEDEFFDEITSTVDENSVGQGPAREAIRERRLTVSQPVQEDPEFEPWREEVVERDARSLAAVPLEYADTLYGVLVVAVDRVHGFDEQERTLLTELGADIAHATYAVELRTHLERYETIIEALGDPVYTLDADGHYTFVNDAFVEETEYSHADIIGEHVSKIVPEEYLERGEEVIRDLLRGGDYRSATWELERITAEGNRVPVWNHVALLPFDEEFRGTAGVLRDITERKEREERLGALHEATRGLMTVTTAREVAERTAEAAEEVLGYPNNVVRLVDETGTRLRPIAVTRVAQIEMGERPAYTVGDGPVGRVYERGAPRIYDDIRTVDDVHDRGEARAVMYLPLGDHGTIGIGDTTIGAFGQSDLYLASVLAANTEAALDRIEREQDLKRQNERLEEFATILSHDLRSPLSVASGRLELARAECESEHLDEAAHAHERMTALIDDTLTLARQGDRVSEMEAIDLATLTENCWRNVEDTGATIITAIDQTIRADRSRLQRLLENLLRNAVEHGNESVTVTIGPLDTGFFVEDDGPGIPVDEREQVFDSGYSTAEEGTGFGLSIIKQIAEAHGWAVSVTDSEAGGARFEITGVEFDG